MRRNDHDDATARTELHNLGQIAMLNQRGGRALSIVDLIEARTLSAEMAGLCRVLVEGGESFLTGAVPGGAGKTTLMAAILGFLPPGEAIITAEDERTVARVAAGKLAPPICLLAHEIGQGTWHAYIWGKVAQQFFSLRGPGRRKVSCLHADNPEQSREILLRCGVRPDDMAEIGFQMFIGAFGSFSPIRRVTEMHCRLGEELTMLYRWDTSRDSFEMLVDRGRVCEALARRHGGSAAECSARWDLYTEFLMGLQRAGVRDYEAVRARIVPASRA